MGRALTADQRANRLASRQHGAITRSQALGAGLTPRQIQWRLETRRWRRARRAVYVVCGTPDTPHQRLMVACLTGPPGTVVSHGSAAALLGLCGFPPSPHVTVSRSASGRVTDVVVHHARVDSLDRCTVGPIPCTHPGRTVVDCAAVLGYGQLCDLLDTALCRRLTDVDHVRAAAGRACRGPGRKGLAQLERALEVWTPGPLPGSPAEMRLARQLHGRGLPVPERQFNIEDDAGGFVARVDLALPDLRIIWEYDGQRHHGPRQRKADAERQRRIETLGFQVKRVDKHALRRLGMVTTSVGRRP